MTDAVYWDACVFLSVVNRIPERLPDLEAMMDAASKGDLRIYTSTLSKVEVAFAAGEQTKGTLDPAVEAQIDELWGTGSPVKMVEFHDVLASDARQLIRDALPKGWSLRPADAIHLATAARHRVSEVHTYDTPLLKYKDLIGIPILHPKAQAPMMSLQAPTPPPAQ